MIVSLLEDLVKYLDKRFDEEIRQQTGHPKTEGKFRYFPTAGKCLYYAVCCIRAWITAAPLLINCANWRFSVQQW